MHTLFTYIFVNVIYCRFFVFHKIFLDNVIPAVIRPRQKQSKQFSCDCNFGWHNELVCTFAQRNVWSLGVFSFASSLTREFAMKLHEVRWVLRSADWYHADITILYYLQTQGASIAQPCQWEIMDRAPLITVVLVQSQALPCGVCGGQIGTGTRFSLSTSVIPCQYQPFSVPYSFLHHRNWQRL